MAACSRSQNEKTPEPTVTLIPRSNESPCLSIPVAPTPGPEAESIFPAITSSDHVRGPADAAITFLVYGDLQNRESALFSKVIDRVQDEHPAEIRYINRVFPLVGRNDNAVLAARMVEAADKQGKFWEMQNLLYSQQAIWSGYSVPDFVQWATSQASSLGMNIDQYQTDLESEAVIQLVDLNIERAREFGPFGVPLIIINGEIYLGPQDYSSVNDVVQLILLGKRQFTDCPPLLITRTGQYIATLHTDKGDVVIQLFADKAPYTVNSFVFLAQNGWYDDITFHRVIPDLYAQTGDPSGTGKGTPGYYVITEILPELTFDKPGLVAMVNSGPDTSGSQFFITFDEAHQYDGQYTIFGQLLNGIDVLKQLTPRNPQIGVELPQGDKLLGVTIEAK